jgi:hypothetical protein
MQPTYLACTLTELIQWLIKFPGSNYPQKIKPASYIPIKKFSGIIFFYSLNHQNGTKTKWRQMLFMNINQMAHPIFRI